ncbi:glycosyltransferase family 25 protein [Morganella morganii]|uniref:glycosyltransferase family 25 protein n=1 Tax=Morganella morganii TaxID=582 RepID=UPI0030FF1233
MLKIHWGFVDKVVYINLAERTDRQESIEFQMKKAGIPQNKIIRFDAIKNENGTLGCTLSHIGVMAMAAEENWENVLVLEDDMIFNDDDESGTELIIFSAALCLQNGMPAYCQEVISLSNRFMVVFISYIFHF